MDTTDLKLIKILSESRFEVVFPKELKLESFFVKKTDFLDDNEIDITLAETSLKNIRKDFSKFEYSSISDFILIKYLDETGNTLWGEKFIGIKFKGITKVSNLDYSSVESLSTTIRFSYLKKEFVNATAS